MTRAETFWDDLKVTESGCREWTGYTDRKGYGQIRVHGKLTSTHRFAWEQINGPIPEGMFICHRCDNPPCCNVERCLFLGTVADNNADMMAKGRGRAGEEQRSRTSCPRNHPYDEVNTYWTPTGSHRMCRACAKARNTGPRVVTCCPQNHPYDDANTYVTPKGSRMCRTCMNARNRAWRASKRLAVAS
jgi:hypothetical protein